MLNFRRSLLNKNRAMKICNMILESGMKVYFHCQNGMFINSLDEELITLMRKAGFIRTALAVESGSQYIRSKVVGKSIAEEKIRNVFELCKNVGIQTNMFLILGFPEETEQTIAETERYIDTIDSDRYGLFILKPLPGTALFEQCKRDDIFADNLTYDTLWQGGIEKDILEALHPWEYEKATCHVFIKPYELSVEYVSETYTRLMEKIKAREEKWISHVKSVLAKENKQ